MVQKYRYFKTPLVDLALFLVHALAAHLLGDDADAVSVGAFGRCLDDVFRRRPGVAAPAEVGCEGL